MKKVATDGIRQNEPLVQYAIVTELQRFIEQAQIEIRSTERATNQLYQFANNKCLDTKSSLGPRLHGFIENTVDFISRSSEHLTVDADGPRIADKRLDRLIIANHLWDWCTRKAELPVSRNEWDADICNILSFLSGASKRRYEHSPAEMAVSYSANRKHPM